MIAPVSLAYEARASAPAGEEAGVRRAIPEKLLIVGQSREELLARGDDRLGSAEDDLRGSGGQPLEYQEPVHSRDDDRGRTLAPVRFAPGLGKRLQIASGIDVDHRRRIARQNRAFNGRRPNAVAIVPASN